MGLELGDDQEPEGQKAKAKVGNGLEEEGEEFAAHGIRGLKGHSKVLQDTDLMRRMI